MLLQILCYLSFKPEKSINNKNNLMPMLPGVMLLDISPVSRNWPMRDRKVIGHKVYVVIGKWMPMCKSLCVVT